MKKNWFINAGSNRIPIYIANGFFSRLRGLIGRELAEEEGLVLSPCDQIHCMFMSYPIDVLYLSGEKSIIRIERDMKPWSLGKRVKGCRYVLEMKSGSANRYDLTVGTVLQFSKMEVRNG